jgi:Icc-related predicted phosphoesterase
MRVHVVSDVHGRTDALARAGDGADVLLCLGDLILYVDYDDTSQGIFADLFGADAAARLVELRTAKRWDDARRFSQSLTAGTTPEQRSELFTAAVRRQYATTFAAMPTPSYVTYGNVDLPALWPEFARPGVQVLDGQRVEIGGKVVGFVGGGLQTPYRTPYEISDEEYAAKVAAVGPVDVLACHIPPAVPELLYDVRARRFERGSEALLDAIRDTQPGLVLFGHVHNPLVRRRRIHRTECVNVGHFRSTGVPFKIDW